MFLPTQLWTSDTGSLFLLCLSSLLPFILSFLLLLYNHLLFLFLSLCPSLPLHLSLFPVSPLSLESILGLPKANEISTAALDTNFKPTKSLGSRHLTRIIVKFYKLLARQNKDRKAHSYCPVLSSLRSVNMVFGCGSRRIFLWAPGKKSCCSCQMNKVVTNLTPPLLAILRQHLGVQTGDLIIIEIWDSKPSGTHWPKPLGTIKDDYVHSVLGHWLSLSFLYQVVSCKLPS